jgi:hypothetical protein
MNREMPPPLRWVHSATEREPYVMARTQRQAVELARQTNFIVDVGTKIPLRLVKRTASA